MNDAEILIICSRSKICVPDLSTVMFYVSSRMCQYLMFPNDAAAKTLTKTALFQVTVIRGWCTCHVNGLFSLNDIIWMLGCPILKTCNQSVSAKSTFPQESWTIQLHLFYFFTPHHPSPPCLFADFQVTCYLWHTPVTMAITHYQPKGTDIAAGFSFGSHRAEWLYSRWCTCRAVSGLDTECKLHTLIKRCTPVWVCLSKVHYVYNKNCSFEHCKRVLGPQPSGERRLLMPDGTSKCACSPSTCQWLQS